MQELVEVIDEQGKPTGQIATYDEVRTQGLFKRGVNIIIYTAGGRIVMQRRSPKLDFHPSQIEVSVGGGVIAGELPAQAAVRELREELGLVVSESELVYLGRKKFNHTYKKQGKTYYMRTFDYFYKLKIAEAKLSGLTAVDGEASLIFTISKRKLVWSLRRHYVRGYGRLMPLYSFWAFMVKSI